MPIRININTKPFQAPMNTEHYMCQNPFSGRRPWVEQTDQRDERANLT